MLMSRFNLGTIWVGTPVVFAVVVKVVVGANVTEGLSASRNRSKAARLVFRRAAISDFASIFALNKSASCTASSCFTARSSASSG